jgi:hypothetical protein
MIKSNFNRFVPAVLLACTLFAACSKTTPAPTLLKHWDIALNAKFEEPAPAGRSETGSASLNLYSDKTLKYTLTVTGLASSDQLVAGHIHLGDPLTSGPVLVALQPTFSNGTATGTVTVRSTLSDSLINGAIDFYVNIHSSQAPSGLMRGQLYNPVTFAQDVMMSGANEVPAINTMATGIALFRLTTDKTLYAKYTVSNIEAGDTSLASHVHSGATGVNGPVIIPICASAADFGKSLKIPGISDANLSLLTTGMVYANVHSHNQPGGLIRGQLR